MDKEKTYVSAVVYLRNCAADAQKYLPRLAEALDLCFENSEIVLVNDCSSDDTADVAKKCAEGAFFTMPVTLVSMSIFQGTELCMTAGVDAAIGDFVFEFDTLCPIDEKLMRRVYETSLEGFDIVNVSPEQNRSRTSGYFYKIFNACSNSQYKLHTDIFRLLSRRAINRVRSMSKAPVYRKAAYASSGLKMTTVFEPSLSAEKSKSKLRLNLAVDSLALYTDAAYRLSLGISLLMLTGTFAEILYTVIIYLGGSKPIEGWTTTMLVLTIGFFGVFLILTLILKYVSLLVNLVFKKNHYLVENIEKL